MPKLEGLFWDEQAAINNIITRLTNIEHKIDLLTAVYSKQGKTLMATIADIQTAVANETSVVQSAVTLLNSLTTSLKAALAAGDPAAAQAVVDQISAATQSLADAVAANTPAAAT